MTNDTLRSVPLAHDAHLALDGAPRVMGILNVTPDSFSDGGRFVDVDRAVAHARAMVDAGAALIDVGGESTRPGAAAVDAETERARVLPVIERLRGVDALISIDTSKAAVARAAIVAGAHLINDVTALGDPEMAATAASTGAGLVLMHMQGEPRTMQNDPRYDDVVRDVRAHLAVRIERAEAAGVDPQRIVVDPGIGFGKRLHHNLALIARIGDLRTLGRPILLGASRKSFLGEITGVAAADERVAASLAIAAIATASGVDILRVHDVRETVHVVQTVMAVNG